MIEGFIAFIILLGGLYYLHTKKVTKITDDLREVTQAKNQFVTEKNDAENKVIELQKQHSEFVTKVKVEMSAKVEELEAKYKKNADDRVQKVINDYEEALKLETENLEKQVAELDEQLGYKIQEITGKNTMYFTCACDRSKQIPCSVDLSSDENYFTCPECGAVYRIVINASTVLMSGITNNPKIASLYDGKEIGEVDRTML